MADVTTPSAVAMSTIGAAATATEDGKTKTGKPEKPDEEAFKKAQDQKRKDLEAAQAKAKELETSFNASKPNNKDSPNAQRQAELKTELAAIRSKQQTNKLSRTSVQERINALDAQLKTKLTDQKNARGRVPFKSVEEIDQRIAALTKEVDSGRMKIVDEKKTLGEISGLNRQKKDLSGLDVKQKEIDALKQKISDTKKEFENPEIKALSAEYDQKQSELNKLKEEQDATYKNRDVSKEAYHSARTKQNQIYQELKKLQDEYYGAKRAFSEWERESRRQYAIKKKTENEARDLERKRRVVEEELETARTPAYFEHIQACNTLIRLLDPTSSANAKNTSVASQFAAAVQRTVDDAGFKGTRLKKKGDDEEDYFIGGPGKKTKKGKGKGGEGTPNVDVGIFYAPGVSEQFEKIGVSPPSSAEDQARALHEVKEKRTYYETNQDEKTKAVSRTIASNTDHQNIAAAEKKLAAVSLASDAEAGHTNGDSGASADTSGKGQAAAEAGAEAQAGVEVTLLGESA